MTWFKTDDKLWGHPKWRAATKGARALWSTAGSWSADQLTDGHIPTHMLPLLDGTLREAQKLVEVGLWETTKDGWKFHDWDDHQPTRADVLETREKERERKRKWRESAGRGADGRYVSQGDTTRDTHRDTTGDSTGDSQQESRRSRPDPSRPSSPLTPRRQAASLLGWAEDDERLDQVDTLLKANKVRSPGAWLNRCHLSGDLEHLLTHTDTGDDDGWSHLPELPPPPGAP